MNPETHRDLRRRLRPLYVAVFFLSFVLWYAIEKLFLRSIGFDDALIGMVFAVFSAVILFVEIPCGVLADRWSRRGVLVLASLTLLIATLIGGLSYGPPMYFASAVMWAIFFALYSGTCDSIIYDTMIEEKVPTKQFDYYLGRVRVMISIASVAGSLAGGLVAQLIGLRWAYLLTIPLVLPSFIALWKLREPRLHKSLEATSLGSHLRATLRAVLQRGRLLRIIATLSLISALLYTVTEFNQLWSIALLAPIVLYGPINALHLATGGIGGWVAGRVRLNRLPVMLAVLGILLASSLCLVFSRNLALTVAAIAVFCSCLYAITIVFNRYLHELIPSNVRAGASSMTSTIGRIIIIPLSLGIGYLSTHTDIFHASWLVVGLAMLLSVLIIRSYFGKHALQKEVG